MAKIYTKIGFAVTEETAPGVWVDHIVEREYYGLWLRDSKRAQVTDQVNDNIVAVNQLSIVLDPYANENYHAIKYAVYMGTKWKVTSAEVRYPRLILYFGGVFNAADS